MRRQKTVQGRAHTSCVYKKVQRHQCAYCVLHTAIGSVSHGVTTVVADMYTDCMYVQFLTL